MAGKKMEALFCHPTRTPEADLEQFHKDIAASLQKITEEVMLKIARHAKKITGSRYLCLAGGVALNCRANSVILRTKLFDDIFIQPAAGDAGGALGAALAVWHKKYDGERLPRLNHVDLGNEYSESEIGSFLRQENLPFEKLTTEAIIEKTARLITGDNVIGWFQGRMEYGPRALGHRSIIADARNKANWQKVNMKIKFRESFRPFAPTVLMEKVQEYFDINCESPYMLLTADVRPEKRQEIPAVTHVDGSARVQTVRADDNPTFHALLSAFQKQTGCGVIINTSFNVRGEPIVESPKDALHCFLNTDMDFLILGTFLLEKTKMPKDRLKGQEKYRSSFQLD